MGAKKLQSHFAVDDFFKMFWDTQLLYKDDNLLDQLSWPDFIKVVSTMNIRSGGTKLERRVLDLNNWDKVKGHKNHGDGRTKDGKVLEIKSSIISPHKSSKVSFKGVRPWHKVDYHYFIIVNMKDYFSEPVTNVLMLNHEQILFEANEMESMKPYGGKKADREGVKNVQLGAAFKKGDLERWIKKYSVKINL